MFKNLIACGFLSLTLVILASGCATMQSIDIGSRSRIMEADYQTTMKAAIDYLNSEAWQIAALDKEVGLINTEFKSESGLATFFTGGERYKLNFWIQRQSDRQTKVVANVLHETKSGVNPFHDGTWAQAPLSERAAIEKYNEILGGIQSKLAN